MLNLENNIEKSQVIKEEINRRFSLLVDNKTTNNNNDHISTFDQEVF